METAKTRDSFFPEGINKSIKEKYIEDIMSMQKFYIKHKSSEGMRIINYENDIFKLTVVIEVEVIEYSTLTIKLMKDKEE